jgi:hypothetical protein
MLYPPLHYHRMHPRQPPGAPMHFASWTTHSSPASAWLRNETSIRLHISENAISIPLSLVPHTPHYLLQHLAHERSKRLRIRRLFQHRIALLLIHPGSQPRHPQCTPALATHLVDHGVCEIATYDDSLWLSCVVLRAQNSK